MEGACEETDIDIQQESREILSPTEKVNDDRKEIKINIKQEPRISSSLNGQMKFDCIEPETYIKQEFRTPSPTKNKNVECYEKEIDIKQESRVTVSPSRHIKQETSSLNKNIMNDGFIKTEIEIKSGSPSLNTSQMAIDCKEMIDLRGDSGETLSPNKLLNVDCNKMKINIKQEPRESPPPNKKMKIHCDGIDIKQEPSETPSLNKNMIVDCKETGLDINQEARETSTPNIIMKVDSEETEIYFKQESNENEEFDSSSNEILSDDMSDADETDNVYSDDSNASSEESQDESSVNILLNRILNKKKLEMLNCPDVIAFLKDK